MTDRADNIKIADNIKDVVVFQDIPVNLDLKDIINKCHLNNENDIERVTELVDEAIEVARPRGIFKESHIQKRGQDYVIINGIKFNSHVMYINLKDIYKVYPYIVTAGSELETWASNFNDILENYWADIIQKEILEGASNYIFARLKDIYNPGSIAIMNPGSLDWPISEQKKLFKLLGNYADRIGVRLTDSYLMVPTKSLSGLVFPSTTDFKKLQIVFPGTMSWPPGPL